MREIQPAFSGDLLATLWNKRDLVGSETFGDAQHLVGAGHLEVQHGHDGCGETFDVVVLNVTPVLAQVSRDAVGAGALAQQRALHGIGKRGAARLSKGRDVVDVDVQPLPFHSARHLRRDCLARIVT
jgi:hypothetical protein